MKPAPRPRRRRADQKESLRREILDAARGLFAAEGYGSVSLRKIASRIGYTPMSIYLHFQHKSDILDCICEETFTRLLESKQLRDRERPDSPPRERLAAGLRDYVEFGLAHPHHYQLTFMTPPHEPLDLGRREQIGQEAYQRLRQLVASCLDERRRAAVDPDVASQMIWTSVHGLTSLLIARPDFPWAEREELIEGVVRTALSWLSGGGPGLELPETPPAPSPRPLSSSSSSE
ncbi:MAG: TetR/AcrR family transcriptional regulator [Acidobacteriota bacterium]|nr:TetR/AcrR family transcriptional regulator [Acidobacteriota bacterium]